MTIITFASSLVGLECKDSYLVRCCSYFFLSDVVLVQIKDFQLRRESKLHPDTSSKFHAIFKKNKSTPKTLLNFLELCVVLVGTIIVARGAQATVPKIF